MHDYPEVIAKIVQDYLDRLKKQLSLVPSRDQDEFLREISSHVFEAYHRESSEDKVERILAVLRKLGEPSEVVAERLPQAMVNTGRRRHLPLYVIGGILIAAFGIPLGFGGVAVLIGMLAAILGVVVGIFATGASLVLVGLIVMVLGLVRTFEPQFWDQLVSRGFIHIEGHVAEFLDMLSPAGQGALLMLLAAVLAVSGLALLWLGKYLLRGVRFLAGLWLDWARKAAPRVRSFFRREGDVLHSLGKVSLLGRS